MKKVAISLFAAVSSVFALTVLAHSGHGNTAPSSLAHYLIEPLHTAQALAPLALVAISVWLLRRKRSRV